jgi:predicted nuclease with TOPRIM domain
MIIKNKEDRSSAIWRFILISAPFALLLFLGGFTTGNTFKAHEENCTENLRIVSEKVTSLEAEMAQTQRFFQRGDSVMNSFIKEFEELGDRLSKVPVEEPMLAVDMISEVETARKIHYNHWEQQLKYLESDFPTAGINSSAIETGLNYFRKCKELHNLRIMRETTRMKAAASQGRVDELQSGKQQLDKEKEAFGKEKEMGNLRSEMKELERKYNKCVEDKPASMGGSGRDYSKETSQIVGEVDFIKKQIIPKMQVKFIGSKQKKMDELKDKLNASLDKIRDNAKDIQ